MPGRHTVMSAAAPPSARAARAPSPGAAADADPRKAPPAVQGARGGETTAGSRERSTLVLTGASRGIGHATVKLFARAGWRIITCSRQPFEPGRCPWEAGPEDHVRVDLADREAVSQAIDAIKARLGGAPLHALVNNAGVSPKAPDGSRLGALATPVAAWMSVFQVNFLAPALLARGLFHELKAGAGAVVNVTSMVGSRVHPFAGTAYATSKAALACLTREMAHDFAPHGVRVNAIAPGEIGTGTMSPDVERQLVPGIPMHRVGTPEEVAQVIVFLCSPAASYLTGGELHINGGQHV